MRWHTHLWVAGALTASLAALPDSATAQLTTGITVDTNAVGNALAIPFVTHSAPFTAGFPGFTATVINISNTKDIVFGQAGPVYLHFEVISGDVAGGAGAGFLNPAGPNNRTNTTINDFWVSQDVVCITTPGETTQITIEPYPQAAGEQSMWMFECSDPDEAPGLPGDHGDRFTQNGSKSFGGTQSRIFDAKNGILWVTQETLPHSGIYKEGDILEGRAHVMEMDEGGAYILDAIPFNGLAEFDGADGEWRFDGREYPNAPLNWMSSVILPDASPVGMGQGKRVRAEFLLFSLDGNISAKKGPRPKFEYMWYDDDENRQQSDTFWFECFAWIDLDEDLNINARTAGTPTGHVRLKHLAQTSITDTVHDADHDAGVSDGKRVYPFYGYLVQRYDEGAMIQKSCVHPDNAGLGNTQGGLAEGNVCGITDVIGNPTPEMFAGYAVTAHLLTKGSNAMIPTSGDRPAMTRN